MRRGRGRAAVLTAALVLASAAPACKSSRPAGGISAEATSKAAELFQSRCSPCHGESGHGDGPASAELKPPPRNMTDPAWQRSVTDEQIEKIIASGGAAVGKSMSMPPNPDLARQPEIVRALRAKVRSFGR